MIVGGRADFFGTLPVCAGGASSRFLNEKLSDRRTFDAVKAEPYRRDHDEDRSKFCFDSGGDVSAFSSLFDIEIATPVCPEGARLARFRFGSTITSGVGT